MRKRTNTPMLEALAWARQHGFEPYRATEHQLKIGEANFYPGKGTVFVDGETTRRKETGLDALAEVLRELGYLGEPSDQLEPDT